jgi:hypothetical protein
VPAGTFTAERVELSGKTAAGRSVGAGAWATVPVRAKLVLWYVPEVKRVVKYTRETYTWDGRPFDQDAYELLDFRLH